MNLINIRTLVRGKAFVNNENGNMRITNDSDTHSIVLLTKLFKREKNKSLYVIFNGDVKRGNGCTLKMINRHKTILAEFGLNSESVLESDFYKYFFVVVYVPEHSETVITDMSLSYEEIKEFDTSFLQGDILVVTPGYPSLDNKYSFGFVHTRVKAYLDLGWNVDVLSINDAPGMMKYVFEEVTVVRSNYFFLRCLLQNKKYDKIVIHFFNDAFANVFESVDTSDTMLYLFLHGAETLYRDWPKIASPYFGEPSVIDSELEKRFKIKDFYIEKYSKIKNAKWIFVTGWTKQRCEELLNLKFNNYDVIPCLVDTELFSYQRKDPELRKKIFVLRKFDDINSYSLDTVVRIILELSRRDFFKDLVFDIYGSGSMHTAILEPLRDFENVHIFDTFLSHEEIRKVHEEHGIALFPTRFDSQAVSSCEAAASGCAVITSDIPGTRQTFPTGLGILCNTEEYVEYADVIEKMYNDPDYFLEVAEKESKAIKEKYDYQHTIVKELELYKKEKDIKIDRRIEPSPSPVLSVIIPSYNVSKYLRHTVFSLLDQDNANKIEILIVNDGSKDSTAETAESLRQQYAGDTGSVIKVINKENGGHGSTINVGFEQARGKYCKIVDGDDTVDSEEFKKLIDILEKEESDIVLNNYIEDFAKDNITNRMKIYSHLKPGVKYKFDDLCFDNYGFTSWGPILSCSSYKTEMLRKNPFKLSEKIFYVDMELNINVAVICDTITYYDLNVYRYFLGRTGQSVNRDSYKRNYKHHETVCMNMLKVYYANKDKISNCKSNYITNKLLIPMLSTQYAIDIEYVQKRKPFIVFDKMLKEYPEFYEEPRIKIKKVVFHRRTSGLFVRFNDFFVSLKRILHI